MSILTSIERHHVAITKFNAYSYLRALKEIFLFSYDYYIRGDGKNHAPINIALFLTLKCNAKCSMCNVGALLNKDKNDLTFEGIDKLLKEVSPYKPSITFFGGEPTIRKDFIEIAKRIKAYGMKCGIFTNGTLFTPELIKEIVDVEMSYVVFAMEGIGHKHDDILGIKGAYEKTLNAIKEFSTYKNRKTKIMLHTTILEENLDELGKIVELGEELKVDLIRFGHPTYVAEEDVKINKQVMDKTFPGEHIDEVNYFYDPKEKASIYFDKIKKFTNEYKGRFSMTPDLSLEEMKDWYSSKFKTSRKCYFVHRGAFIYPNGDVVPCEAFKYSVGNINEKPFLDIWNSEKFIKFRRSLKKGLFPGCARCTKT